MASLKNIINIISSPHPTKSITLEPRKIVSFSSPSSLIFSNYQNSALNGSSSAKKSRQFWPIKAVTGEDRDLIAVEKSDKSEGEVEEKGTTEANIWSNSDRLLNAVTGEDSDLIAVEKSDESGGEVEEKGTTEANIWSNSDRLLNAAIVLGAGTLAITRLLTIDHDYSHGWTLYEVLRYAPEHNWAAYEEALKLHPVLAKMMISGIVYSLGDWIAQCYEGKPLFEFDRIRMFRSGIVGFLFHGSLSHYYYQFCEALFPFEDWWVVPAKVAFDQTIWAAVWNSIYYVMLGFLRLESPSSVFDELKATFWPMLTAGWKLWPFAHLITYGVVPVEQRLLWVDCVELIWVTILSGYSNEKSEARVSEASAEANFKEE